jgi:hypothetical protein
MDRKHSYNFDRLFEIFKGGSSTSSYGQPTFKKKSRGFGFGKRDVEDAEFYEINSDASSENVDQQVIDEILDKISRSGYQNLTEREKKILFDASKRN